MSFMKRQSLRKITFSGQLCVYVCVLLSASFWRQGLSLAWRMLIKVGWLAGGPPVSISLAPRLRSPAIVPFSPHPPPSTFLITLVLGTEFRSLCLAMQTVYWLSQFLNLSVNFSLPSCMLESHTQEEVTTPLPPCQRYVLERPWLSYLGVKTSGQMPCSQGQQVSGGFLTSTHPSLAIRKDIGTGSDYVGRNG